MNVQFHPDVFKQLQQLPCQVFAPALKAIVALASESRPTGVKKLVGTRRDWRIRIGEYRIIYEIDDSTQAITVMCVEHRRDAYR